MPVKSECMSAVYMCLLGVKRTIIMCTKFSKGPVTSKGWRIAHLETVPDISIEFQCAGGQLLYSSKVSSSLPFRAGIHSKLPFLIFLCCSSLFTRVCQTGKLRL